VTRKSLLTSLVILAVLLVSGLATGYILLRHEPEAYAQAALPPGPDRELKSEEFDRKVMTLVNDIRCEADWQAEFTESQVNSYLAEDFLRSKPFQLPQHISDPRVKFRPGQVIIGFRYGEGDLSSVVSLYAKVWLPRAEPNLLALEIQQLRAGAMPLAVKLFQDELDKLARSQNLDIQWYRHEGNPVAVIRYQADKREPTIMLKELELRAGVLFVKGRTLEPAMPEPVKTEKTAGR
jgi:hypothetical protein